MAQLGLGDEVGVKLEQRFTGHAEAVIETAQGWDPKEPLDDVRQCHCSAVIIHNGGCKIEWVTIHHEECFLLHKVTTASLRDGGCPPVEKLCSHPEASC